MRILYLEPGAERTDGSALAGTGIPTSPKQAFPRGLQSCPIPGFIVVHFPDYQGPTCFNNLPRTWTPASCVEVLHKTTKSGLTRAGVPLQLACAITTQVTREYNTRGMRRLLCWSSFWFMCGQAWSRFRGMDTRHLLGETGIQQTATDGGIHGGPAHEGVSGKSKI